MCTTNRKINKKIDSTARFVMLQRKRFDACDKISGRNILVLIATAFWEQSRDVPNGTCFLFDFWVLQTKRP